MDMATNASQIRLGDRPLIVCDIDEVVLEFLSPFTAFLRSHSYDLLPRSFRLYGNIVSLLDGSELDKAAVDSFEEVFFANQHLWQTPAERAVETLRALSDDADVVFLTAMPPRHHAIRRKLLDQLDLSFDLIATQEPKGPVVARLHDRRSLPVAFIDDMQRNLLSVADHVPECLLLTMMANADFKPFAPPPVGSIVAAAGWEHAADLLRAHFSADILKIANPAA
ncbi:hypothetical protein SAMN05216228_101943 [Rhizobium tibeticum]|uniref:Uncharacterized protein n=1 Tax=Rhizobium tibeticum TaxID=501024 RepID=A0A1H8QI12_9HYPH|nr:hypothetical protein [Rhizobium tibeticum]SEI04598.1 hypothetical protein RTCCBAU85039_3965 [Rhizobium tibeticum]SEO53875.1 hypothetical protein SAMN05216228_101943 [Rhizobium tibeticum]